MKPAEKKALLERLEGNGLLYKILPLSRREIIVHEATGHTARKMGELSMEIESDKSLNEAQKDALFSLYIPLMSCSAGDLPKDYDDFLWMKNEDIEEWTKQAREMNPNLFSILDFHEKHLQTYLSEQEIQKKKRKRSKSR
jgi:hypothetical protein